MFDTAPDCPSFRINEDGHNNDLRELRAGHTRTSAVARWPLTDAATSPVILSTSSTIRSAP